MKRYHLTTFGCQMNEHDSERMKGMLESLGYDEAPERCEADLILFNTCSIREAADNRFIAHLGEAKRLKREAYPILTKLWITSCPPYCCSRPPSANFPRMIGANPSFPTRAATSALASTSLPETKITRRP